MHVWMCSSDVDTKQMWAEWQIGIWEISKIAVVDSNDKNRENVDCTCHQQVIYDVTVNNCYLWYFPDADLFTPTHSLHS